MRSIRQDLLRHRAIVAVVLGTAVGVVNAQLISTPVAHDPARARPLCCCTQLSPPPSQGAEDGPATRGNHATIGTWPGGVVPFVFDDNVTSENRQRALDAMREIEAVALVTFIPRTSESNFLRLLDSTGNASFVGMTGGSQDVHLFNWQYRYVIIHELMHALGAHHEQSRSDRDQYITINAQNVQQGRINNFDIQPGAVPHGPYDFESIMHYGQYAFSANGAPTITVLPPNQGYQGVIGQINYMSAGDVALLQEMYRPNSPVPFAADDVIMLEGMPPYVIGRATLLANDFDLDGDTLQIASFTQGSLGGSVTTGVQDSLVYVPPSPSFSGEETFDYTLSDDDGADTAKVTLRVPVRGRTIHVDATAGGSGDGTNWTNATPSLATALASAVGGDEIRVAGGVYTPGAVRSSTFLIPAGVRLIGGYPPGGGARDPHDQALVARLSGDLARNDLAGVRSDNAYHVVTIRDADDTTVIDGFIIEGGDAGGAGVDQDRGGGLLISGGAPQIRRCVIVGNEANGDGGGGYVRNASPSFLGCRFIGNGSRTDDAGGVYCEGGAPRFESCVFQANDAADLGGALYSFGGAFVRVVNCTIVDNHADDRAGAIFINAGSTVEIRGSILWGDRAGLAGNGITAINGGIASISHSIVEGGVAGVRLESGLLNWLVGNWSLDPLLVDRAGPDGVHGTGDERLDVLPGSPAIDAGDNSALGSWETDAIGNDRRLDADGYEGVGTGFGAIVDIGAFEAPADIGAALAGSLQLRLVRSDGMGAGAPIDDELVLDTPSDAVTLYVQARIEGDPASIGIGGFQGTLGAMVSGGSGGRGVWTPALLTNAEAFEMLVPPNDDVLGRRGMFTRYRSRYGTTNSHPDNGQIVTGNLVFEAFDETGGSTLPQTGWGAGDGWSSIYKVRWTPSPEMTRGSISLTVSSGPAEYSSLLGDRIASAATSDPIEVRVGDTCPCEADGDPSQVSITDLLTFLDAWIDRTPAGDFDASGAVDILDVLAFLDCWIEGVRGTCP